MSQTVIDLTPPTETASIIADNGRIDLRALAKFAGLTTAELSKVLGVTPRSINSSPTSKNLQTKARELASLINLLTETLGERRFALYWLNTPQRQLSNETPRKWLLEGGLDDVASYVHAFVNMQPD